MAKAGKFLVAIGVLIGIGAALLFIGSQAITSDIIIQEGQIADTIKLELQANWTQKLIPKECLWSKQWKVLRFHFKFLF